MYELTQDPHRVERAFLVGTQRPGMQEGEARALLSELRLLVATLDIPVVGEMLVALRAQHPRLLVGSGKAEEILAHCRREGAGVIVFDDALSPSQQRNWERFSTLCVIDRHEVILDVFARRAQTREAHLQIELARARYSLPRLKRAWVHLSRQYGGGGATQRGEGEQQIELDRRQVAARIHKLEDDLEKVRRQRDTQRRRRSKHAVPTAAVVGYTNAGKSSLLNALTGADVPAADMLFATLDPRTRPLVLPGKQRVLLTDTVGFIRRLPHLLVESFKATLEEALVADFLIHVVDISTNWRDEQYTTTLGVLEEIGVHTKNMLTVFNKIDLVEDRLICRLIEASYPGAVCVSCATGEGLEQLKSAIAQRLAGCLAHVRLAIPHARSDIASLVHRTSDVHAEEYKDGHVLMEASVAPAVYKAVEEFIDRE